MDFIFRLPTSLYSKKKGLKLLSIAYKSFDDINDLYTNEDGSLTSKGIKQYEVAKKLRSRAVRNLGFLSLKSMDQYYEKFGNLF